MRHCLRLLTLLALAACVTDPVPAQTVDTTATREPPGLTTLWAHDFTGQRPAKWALSGQAGCWFSNGSSLLTFTGGQLQVRYPLNWSGGRTPGTLHMVSTCPPATPKTVSLLYVKLTGYAPGATAPTFWQHAVGHKVLFVKVGDPPSSGRGSIILYCGAVSGAGPASRCRFDVKFESAGNPANWNLNGNQYLTAGKPNDIECVLTLSSIGLADGRAECWVNGQPVTFKAGGNARSATALPMRVAGETWGFYGGWLDWTFGGTAGAKGAADLFTLDAIRASGR